MKTIDYTPRHHWDEWLHLPYSGVEHIVHGSEGWRQVQTGATSLDAYWDDVERRLNVTPREIQPLAHAFYAGDQRDFARDNYARHLGQQGHAVALSNG